MHLVNMLLWDRGRRQGMVSGTREGALGAVRACVPGPRPTAGQIRTAAQVCAAARLNTWPPLERASMAAARVPVACRGWIHGRRAHAPPWPPSRRMLQGRGRERGAVAGEEGEVRVALLRLDPWASLKRGL